MTVGEIKKLASDHDYQIEQVWQLQASRFSFEQYYTILITKERKRHIPVWGETLEDLYTNVKNELTKL